jgi:hypothetical protein
MALVKLMFSAYPTQAAAKLGIPSSFMFAQINPTGYEMDYTNSYTDVTPITAAGSQKAYVKPDSQILNLKDVIIDQTVQSNAVLQTWVEGYVYATLREYYIKRHNAEDAQVYAQKYENAWNIVEDQNNLGKWSGGHTRMSSIWQPRQYRQYNIK